MIFTEVYAQKKLDNATAPATSPAEKNNPKPELATNELRLVAHLPAAVKETSGLVLINGHLWTVNDSGNPPEIICIDTITDVVLRKVVIGRSVNSDWESLTQDDSSVYIGDFGNNPGNRVNLRILKISKTDFLNPANDTVQPVYINFVYPDQVHFAPAMNRNNYDCEAFLFYGDSLHLFSKDWLDQQTRHYVLPSVPGRYVATLLEQFPANGLITDAAINEQGNIVLLGYKNTRGNIWKCFCWLLSDYQGSHFFDGKATRVELGSALKLGQTEGIVICNDNTAWLSAESISAEGIHFPAKLFRLNFRKFFRAPNPESN
jgi:hypothetical protein